MSLLRIFCPLSAVPASCQWVLLDDHAGVHPGAGPLAALPKGAGHVELVLAASQVLIARTRLPQAGRHKLAALLAYAAEEKLASDPDANQVSRLGRVEGEEVLAVVHRQRLHGWRDALDAVGIRVDAVYCETLMLPLRSGEWSLAWSGQEGYLRTGEFEGGATDCGDRQAPPLALQLLLEQARARDAAPASIALHVATPAAQPDLVAWQQALGVSLRLASGPDWRIAPAVAGIRIDQEREQWRPAAAMLVRWRHVGWILLAALLLHSAALLTDRLRLASEQHQLRQQMEARFRTLFPDAVAVADPALQTRRQLAQARRAANQPDAGDFPVMLGKVAAALADAPTAELRALSYEDGRMTLEFAAPGDTLVRRIEARLVRAGLEVEAPPTAPRTGHGTVTLTLRSP
ncbi:MAG: type II secretion system protein GspL [Rhodanobacter sp.]